MSDHLPECPCQCTCGGVMFWETDGTGKPTHTPSCAWFSPCICDRLRACEQRVLSVAGPHNYTRGRKDGYAAALSAARDAVAASGGHSDRCICDECYGTAAALAAIDALREGEQ